MENSVIRKGKIDREGKTLFLFDVDATLTPARQPIEENMVEFLKDLSKHFPVAAVGGSDLSKIKEQLVHSFPTFSHAFTENGLVSYKNGTQFHEKKISEFLGEEKLKKLIKFCLRYIADLDIPIQRGTFIEYRTGLINISPIGRNCSLQERKEFDIYNKQAKVLENFKEAVEKEFSEYGLKFSIGGQISFDCFPIGWDKTYCLQFLNEFDNIFFFGDKTQPGGNDHEISVDDRITKSTTVTGPADTINKVRQIIREDLQIEIFNN